MKRTVLLFLCVVLLLLPGCRWFGGGTEPETPVDFPAEVGGICLTSAPQRVLVLSPSLAEIVVDLGYGERLCGRAEECNMPESVAALPSVGRTQRPEREALVQLKPELVLMQSAPSATTAALFETLEIPVAVIPAAGTFDELEELYRQVGCLFAGEETGGKRGGMLFSELKNRLAAIAEWVDADFSDRPVALYVPDTTGSAACGDTVLQMVIQAAGLSNGAQGGSGWLLPADAAARAEWIFCPVGNEEMIKSAALYAQSPAALNNRVVGVDSALFERQGSRLFRAALLMAQTAYPATFESRTTEDGGANEKIPVD